jgi:rhodanese-related sulfurtransferase
MKTTTDVKAKKMLQSLSSGKAKKVLKNEIIDVRNAADFAKGHAEGSINIPLQEIPDRLDEIKKIKSPLVVVCGGGTRHVKAFELLKANGIKSEKGGSWKTIDTTKAKSNGK